MYYLLQWKLSVTFRNRLLQEASNYLKTNEFSCIASYLATSYNALVGKYIISVAEIIVNWKLEADIPKLSAITLLR